jgi:predicted Zn finger-like uncharacterized protein
MIVTCEGCEKKFHLDEHRLKPSGSRVRCKVCQHVFVAYPPPVDGEVTETINLTDELPAGSTERAAAGADDLALKGDALFPEEGAALEGDLSSSMPAAGDDITAQDLLATVTLPEDLQLSLNADLAAEDLPPADQEPPPAGGLPAEEALSALTAEIDFEPEAAAAAELPLEAESPLADELELNLAELDSDGGPAPEPEPVAAAADDQLELDLDLDALALEDNGAAGGAAPDAALAEAVETTETSDAEDPPGDAVPAELELALDDAAPAVDLETDARTAAKDPGVDELDLSDLEAMLEGATGSAPKSPAGSEDVDLELELNSEVAADLPAEEKTQELDLEAITRDLENEASEAPAGGHAEEELDLDFELESEEASLDASATAGAAAEPAADELDFSGMADILESGDKPPAEAGSEISDLDLMLEDEAAPAAARAAGEEESQTQRDLLADIEALLKEEDEPEKSAAPAEASDMEIEFETADGHPPEELFGGAAAQAHSDRPPAEQPATEEFATDEFTRSDVGGATNVLDLDPAEEAVPEAYDAAPARSGSRRPLLAVLAAAVLGLAALVLLPFFGVSIPYLSELGIQVPGIGTLFKAEPEDPAGNLKMIPLAEKISAEFVENATAGRLCVVRGEIRNTYDHPRSAIRVTSKLYTQDKAVAKTASVYAGNLLSPEELATLDLIAINNRFTAKTGTNNSNANIQPGGVVPFMVVFSNLPANLDEYSVEVAGSLK